jgi:hypothetical protein
MSKANTPNPYVPPEVRPDFLQHLGELGLSCADAYRAWCDRHGFSRRLEKTWRERLKERSFFNRSGALARLAKKRRETRRPEAVIQAIFRGEVAEADLTQPHLVEICRAHERSKACDRLHASLLQVLLHVARHGSLMVADPAIPQFGQQDGNTFIAGLLAMTRHGEHWLRPVTTWRPKSHNARRQFSSLAHHLFARWPVPAFMDSAWFQADPNKARYEQAAYLHLGRGENLRTAELPLPYTKRMAHFFMQAPADCSIDAALRWGQIHALGGNERLARAIRGTRLEADFAHDDFWITVLRFFIENPMLDTAHAGPIIDYIYHHKYEGLARPGDQPAAATQSHFSMKGRTADSLLRQVDGWHRAIPHSRQLQAEWSKSGIMPLHFVEGSATTGNLQVWTTVELLCTKELVEEGRRMCHCVASYARSCAHGRASIWRLEVSSREGQRQVLTVEVQRTARLITQAKGKRNAAAGEKHRAILRRWASQAGLTIANWV